MQWLAWSSRSYPCGAWALLTPAGHESTALAAAAPRSRSIIVVIVEAYIFLGQKPDLLESRKTRQILLIVGVQQKVLQRQAKGVRDASGIERRDVMWSVLTW